MRRLTAPRRRSERGCAAVRAWAVGVGLLLAGTIGVGQGAPTGDTGTASLAAHLGFSTLDAIDRDAVGELRLVWSRRIGPPARYQGAPAVDGERLFVAVGDALVALHGATGVPLWSSTLGGAETPGAGAAELPARGRPAIAGGYVIASFGTRVAAWSVEDGAPAWSVDLGTGLAEYLPAHPVVAGDRIVVGTAPRDRGPAPGRVVALDPRDGSVLWTFYVVPQAEEDPGYDSWRPTEPGWRNGIGGGGVFNSIAYDAATETVVFGTGAPAPSERLDGRRRNEGPASPDLFTSGVVAVDATNGRLRWHVPVVPGDEWAYDQDSVPVIVDVRLGAFARRVVLFGTSTGYLLVIDVASGELLRSHGLAPDRNVHLGYASDGSAIVDDAMRYLGERVATSVCPAPAWAGTAPGAFDAVSGLYLRPNDTTCVQMGSRPPVERADDEASTLDPVWMLAHPRLAEDYYARWGALTAVDPETGAIAWEVATPYPHDAGALVTAGGLVFSAFADRTFRALATDTGELLWSQVLSAHAEGTPVTYAVDDVQYIVVAAGHPTGSPGLPASGVPHSVAGPITLFGFALPPLSDAP